MPASPVSGAVAALRHGLWNAGAHGRHDHATCTFVNVRPGVPAIALVKTGPLTATAGDTLRYTLYVTNIGEVPIPADAVNVTDETCDDPPELVSKNGDTSPSTLDPDETWTYKCSHKTSAGGDDCEPTENRQHRRRHGPARQRRRLDLDDHPVPGQAQPADPRAAGARTGPAGTGAGTRATARPSCATGTAAARRR